ncbi:unnamed protein product [Owenia fusiformis]|uniref:Uncharacterized protein n=1 Tax=Owenia fusiformis TaxID=6347 RepID=A0A8J1XMS4_OWEFU|nr:unnamed protein product [Owenia fusiformis]
MADQSSEKWPEDVKHKLYKPFTNQFTCSHCFEQFPTFGAIKRHISVHTKSPNEAMKEPEDESSEKDTAKGHEKETKLESSGNSVDDHEIDKGKKHQCKLCNKTFGFASSASRHKKTAHQGTRYHCTKCGNQYSRQDGLIRHMRREHLSKH